MSWLQKLNLKAFLKHYGIPGLVTYELISLGTLGCVFGAIRLGVDVQPLTQWMQEKKTLIYHKLNIQVKEEDVNEGEEDHSEWGLLGTQFLLALAIDKLFFPLRMAGTLYCTPKMSQFLLKRGWMKNKS
jgi:hypothetical protein